MTMITLRVDIVSAEKEIFSGEAEMVSITGELGEIGVTPGHAPLVTSLRPGNVRVLKSSQQEEIFYVSSGMLEVQPYVVTVLADTAIRAKDIDEAAAVEAKERAEKKLSEKGTEIDFAKANAELVEALAQIKAVQQLRKLKK